MSVDTTTTNYEFVKPGIGGSADTWGTKLNDNFDAIDAQLKTNADAVVAATEAFEERLPAGVIAMWSGSVANVPSGWALCDGENGTPDLRDRFVMGAGGSRAPGDTGGAESRTTSTNGSHSHSVSVSVGSTTLNGSQMSHRHETPALLGASSIAYSPRSAPHGTTGNTSSAGGGGGANITNRARTWSGGVNTTSPSSHTHSGSGSSGSSGNHNHTVDTVPPFYALAFIMKL